VDQFIDSTDVLSEPEVFPATASIFDAWTAEAKAD